MAESPTFQIPKDVIEPIIQAHISSAVAAALGGKDKLVSDAIFAALNMKVDERGNACTYSSSIPFVQWLMKDAIQKAAKEAVQTALAGQHEALKESIAKELRNSKSVLAKQLIESLAGTLSKGNMLDYRLSITVAER